MGRNNLDLHINNSIERIYSHKKYYAEFASIHEWIGLEEESIVRKELPFLESIKHKVISKYWKNDIFISQSALDDIIFYAIQTFDKEYFFEGIDDIIKKNNLNRNSVVIFPLHSFGFKYGGLSYFSRDKNPSYIYKNFQIFSQTNSLSDTKLNIKTYLDNIRLPHRNKLDMDMLDHLYISRSLKWLELNPVMLINFRFSQYERYDNLMIINEKINFIINKIYFLSVLANKEAKMGTNFSTRIVNNNETLDIKHFLSIIAGKKTNDWNCIPIFYSNLMIYEKMHLNIDLLLKNKPTNDWEIEAIEAIDYFYKGYMNYVLTNQKKYRIYYRIYNSLEYFRRSVRSLSKEDKTININIAFETLLLDNHEREKRIKMTTRLYKSIKTDYNEISFNNIINERNKIVHCGEPASNEINFTSVYIQYCRFILFFKRNMRKINSEKDNYLVEFYSKIK